MYLTTLRNNRYLLTTFDYLNKIFLDQTPARRFASPAVNVIENEQDYTLELAAPGMTKNDFNVRLYNDNELVISLKNEEEKEEKRNFLRREFSYVSYQQTFQIPDDVNIEGISASMTDGVLTITLPKKEAMNQVPASRQITIG